MKRIRVLLYFLLLSNQVYGSSNPKYHFEYSKILSVPDLSFLDQVYSGLDILEQMDFSLLKNKNIAILTNQTAVNRNDKHLLDILDGKVGIKIKFLFALEHGIWGIDDQRSKMIGRDQIDPVHGAQIIDLFNTYLYPPHWAMDKIDLILIDFQDTGNRYATYLATMSKVFEAASNHKIPILLLDRPNPIRGDIINGPVPRTEFQSFESYHLLPIRHGLTIGELALMINELGWTKDSKRVDLNILPLSNWKRNMWFNDTGLPWRNPNPFIVDGSNLLAYCGFDLFRGTNLNVGFGTDLVFMVVGAPWLTTTFLLEKINNFDLPGVDFKEVKYRPSGTFYSARVPRFDGLSCSGIQISINNRDDFQPIVTATTLMLMIERLHPRQFKWAEDDYIDKLYGTKDLRIIAAQKKPPSHLPAIWAKDVYTFSDFRKKFLIYR